MRKNGLIRKEGLVKGGKDGRQAGKVDPATIDCPGPRDAGGERPSGLQNQATGRSGNDEKQLQEKKLWHKLQDTMQHRFRHILSLFPCIVEWIVILPASLPLPGGKMPMASH